MRRGRGWFLLALVVLATAAAGFGAAGWMLRDDQRAPRLAAPSRQVVHLDRGARVVYVQAAAGEPDVAATGLASVTITAPGGSPVLLHGFGGSFGPTSVSRGGAEYRSAITFGAPVDGDYTVVVAGGRGREVVVGRPVATTSGGLPPGELVRILSEAAAAVGLALLGVSAVRGTADRPARERSPVPGPAPW